MARKFAQRHYEALAALLRDQRNAAGTDARQLDTIDDTTIAMARMLQADSYLFDEDQFLAAARYSAPRPEQPDDTCRCGHGGPHSVAFHV